MTSVGPTPNGPTHLSIFGAVSWTPNIQLGMQYHVTCYSNTKKSCLPWVDRPHFLEARPHNRPCWQSINSCPENWALLRTQTSIKHKSSRNRDLSTLEINGYHTESSSTRKSKQWKQTYMLRLVCIYEKQFEATSATN
jgi:hypothetical protein